MNESRFAIPINTIRFLLFSVFVNNLVADSECYAYILFVCLLLFYVLVTSMAISGWVLTCDSALMVTL